MYNNVSVRFYWFMLLFQNVRWKCLHIMRLEKLTTAVNPVFNLLCCNDRRNIWTKVKKSSKSEQDHKI